MFYKTNIQPFIYPTKYIILMGGDKLLLIKLQDNSPARLNYSHK